MVTHTGYTPHVEGSTMWQYTWPLVYYVHERMRVLSHNHVGLMIVGRTFLMVDQGYFPPLKHNLCHMPGLTICCTCHMDAFFVGSPLLFGDCASDLRSGQATQWLHHTAQVYYCIPKRLVHKLNNSILFLLTCNVLFVEVGHQLCPY